MRIVGISTSRVRSSINLSSFNSWKYNLFATSWTIKLTRLEQDRLNRCEYDEAFISIHCHEYLNRKCFYTSLGISTKWNPVVVFFFFLQSRHVTIIVPVLLLSFWNNQGKKFEKGIQQKLKPVISLFVPAESCFLAKTAWEWQNYRDRKYSRAKIKFKKHCSRQPLLYMSLSKERKKKFVKSRITAGRASRIANDSAGSR